TGKFTTAVGAISTPGISGTTSFCPGGSTTLTTTGGPYYAYSWSTGDSSASVHITQPNTYTITTFYNCASASATATVTNLSIPTVSITPATTSICPGTSVSLTASGGGTYAWSTGANVATINVSPGSQTTYTVTVTGGNTCTASGSRTISIYTPPTIGITPGGSLSICSGASTTLTGTGGTSYVWSTSATTGSINVSPTVQTTYTVTATDNNTCTGSASKTVNITYVPSHISANGPVSFCTGGSVTLNVDTAGSSYSWSNGATTRAITVTSGGSYTCTVTNNSCTATSNTITVSVSGSSLTPTISASNGLQLCTGGSTTLDAGAGYDTYNWSTSSSAQSISANTTATYTVTVTQGACSGTATASVTVGTFPVSVSISPVGPVSVCAGTPVTFDAGGGYATYLWSSGETTESISPTTGNTYTVVVTENNACTGTTSVDLTVNPIPTASISPSTDQSICAGQSVTFDAGSGSDSYLWSNGETSQTITITSNGGYAVQVTQNGCTSIFSDTVNVTVNSIPSPAISVTGNQAICQGQSLNIAVSSTYDSYAWSNGATTQSIAATSAATYYVTVTQNGCSGAAADSVVLTVNAVPSASVSELGTASGFALLQASPAGASYQWLMQTSPNGSYTLTSHTTQLDTVVCTSTATYYTVVATENGCSDTSSAQTVLCSGLEDISSLLSFTIQPNPATNNITITYNLDATTELHLSLIDMTGKKVKEILNATETAGSHRYYLDVSDLPSGLYLVNCMSNNGSFNTKFIKQQ
ncbi:MAG TPA: T9SS type A sorting domain-containing protein, partial [Chitinophagales bacterium]|nr:T9SS type A sorting domain-containing protein [Chitinophagales bacterium]